MVKIRSPQYASSSARCSPPTSAVRHYRRPRMRLDPFLHRIPPHRLPELMDAPASLDTLRGCLRSLEQVNRLTGAYRPTLDFLARALTRARQLGLGFTPTTPLRILDLGSGGGDTLVRIARWAAIRRLPVHLTGVDLNPQSARLARETELRNTSCHPRLRPAQPIHWITADALTLAPAPPPHLVLSSLFFHHLEDPQIVDVLRWQHRTASLGWFLSDLTRSARAARLFSLLAHTLRWHPFVQHDGPVSFRRAFRPADWLALLDQAGIPATAVRLLPAQPARLCLEHLR